MAGSSDIEVYSPMQNNIIDLDNYMKGSVFQYGQAAPAPDTSFVVDGGSYDRSSPTKNKVPSAPRKDTKPPYQKQQYYKSTEESTESSSTFEESCYSKRHQAQYSLDSGVSDGCRHRKKHKKPNFHSNVDVYERRRKHEFERSNHKLNTRRTEEDIKSKNQTVELEIIKNFEEKYEQNLKQQQEKIDRLAALCEECLQPKRQSRELKEPSSSDLSSSVSTKDEFNLRKVVVHSDKCIKSQKNIEKVDECKTYKIIMKKLDELNKHFANKPQITNAKSMSESKTSKSSDSVSVSDKGVCANLPLMKDKVISPKLKCKTISPRVDRKLQRKDQGASSSSLEQTAEQNQRRRKPTKADKLKDIDDSNPETRKRGSFFNSESSGYERLENNGDMEIEVKTGGLGVAEATRLRHIYTAFAKNEFYPMAQQRNRIGDYDANMYGWNEYNLNDPISFYRKSKDIGERISPKPSKEPPKSICMLCRCYWFKLRTSGRVFCKQMLCCGDGVSMSSGLLQESAVVHSLGRISENSHSD